MKFMLCHTKLMNENKTLSFSLEGKVYAIIDEDEDFYYFLNEVGDVHGLYKDPSIVNLNNWFHLREIELKDFLLLAEGLVNNGLGNTMFNQIDHKSKSYTENTFKSIINDEERSFTSNYR